MFLAGTEWAVQAGCSEMRVITPSGEFPATCMLQIETDHSGIAVQRSML